MKIAEVRHSIYPSKLIDLGADMPEVIYYEGHLPMPSRPSVAVLGSRRDVDGAHAYGSFMARNIGTTLAKSPYQLITGLSSGMDLDAVKGYLSCGGMNAYLVNPCGPDKCYPIEHYDQYRAIKEYGGIISRYPEGTDPHPDHFPERAKMIVALCDVLVVADTGHNHELLSELVDFALAIGRVVMAPPGRVTDGPSSLTNDWIATGKALPILDFEDVVNVLKTFDIRERATRAA